MYNDRTMPAAATLKNRKNTIEIRNLPATLGRSNDSVDLYLYDESVSRSHCLFEYINGKITVRDLGSTAGTFINGVKLEANVPYNLENGCKLTIGKVKFTFRADYDELSRRGQAENIQVMPYEPEQRFEAENRKKTVTVDARELSIYEYDESEVVHIECGLKPEVKHLSYTSELKKKEVEKARQDELKQTQLYGKVFTLEDAKKVNQAAAPAEKPAAAASGARPALLLSWIDDETGETKKLRIDRFPFSIGRKSDENDYAVRKAGMSRRHMRFEEAGGTVYIIDDNSTNGVRVNGTKLEAGKRYELRAGDHIRVAEITFNVSMG